MQISYLQRFWALVSNGSIETNDVVFRTNRCIYVIGSSYFLLATLASISVIDIFPARSVIIMPSNLLLALVLAIPKLREFHPVVTRASASALNYLMLFLVVGGAMLVAKYI